MIGQTGPMYDPLLEGYIGRRVVVELWKTTRSMSTSVFSRNTPGISSKCWMCSIPSARP